MPRPEGRQEKHHVELLYDDEEDQFMGNDITYGSIAGFQITRTS